MKLENIKKISYKDISVLQAGWNKHTHIFCDTETIQGKIHTLQYKEKRKKPVLVYTNTDYCLDHFHDLLERLYDKNLVVWFYNLSFDLPIILNSYMKLFLLDEFDIKVGEFIWHIVCDKTWFADVIYKKKKIQIRDAYQYLPLGLEKSGQALGLKIHKLKRPDFLGQRAWETEKEKKSFEAYSLRDVVVLEGLVDWIDKRQSEIDIPQTVSAAHMAGSNFRKNFLKTKIKRLPKNCLVPALLSYHGGKTEVYRETPIFIHNIFMWDITSAYPYAMTQLPNFSDYEIIYDASPQKIFPHAIYRISGNIQDSYIPLYNNVFQPWRGENNGCVTGYELLNVSNLNELNIHEGYIVESNTGDYNPLQEYIDFYFKEKNTAINETKRLFAKLQLNSLYGKFISRIKKDTEDGLEEWNGGSVFNPLIASLITGYTRAYVYKIEKYLKSIHTSTDSFMTHKKNINLTKFGRADGLGGLKLEAEGNVLIFRRKLYIIFDEENEIKKYALHGFHAGIDQLLALYKNRSQSYNAHRMVGLREGFKLKNPELSPFSFHNFEKKININWKNYSEE